MRDITNFTWRDFIGAANIPAAFIFCIKFPPDPLFLESGAARLPKKRQKPDHTTPTKHTDNRTKENLASVCPVCDAVIIEDGDDVSGDDAV